MKFRLRKITLTPLNEKKKEEPCGCGCGCDSRPAEEEKKEPAEAPNL